MKSIKEQVRHIHFIYRSNAINVGDRYSSPYLYFEFEGFKKKKTRSSGNGSHSGQFPIAIIGGGLCGGWSRYMLNNKHNRTILWGSGIPKIYQNLKLEKALLKTVTGNPNILAGIRDWNTPLEWVPCASCMLPQLDKKYDIKREWGVYENKGVPKIKPHDLMLGANKIPYEASHNYLNINDAIKFLGESETIITSSYHGAYWGTLLGRRVIVVPPLKKNPNNKARTLKWKPEFSLNKRPHIYDEALGEAREANQNFYDKVMDYLTI